MIDGQPTPGIKATKQGKRKLVGALLAGALLWLPVTSANAVITNTVTATGTLDGLPITDSASAQVDVVDSIAQMTIVKTGVLNDGGDGSADPLDTINYTFTITNTGNVTLQNITLIDGGATVTGLSIPSLPPGTFDGITFSAVHILTAGDISTGAYVNNVTAFAHAASGEDISAVDSESTALTVVATMQLDKSGVLDMGLNGRADAGDKITYSFKVTNTGPTPLHNVKISDPLVNLASLPGQDRMVAMLDAEQQPVDQINTASIADATNGLQYFAAPDQYLASQSQVHDVPQITTDLTAVRRVVRMSGTTETVAAGDKIGFVYALNNTGEGPLTNITVHQPDALAYGDSLDLLAANVSDSANIIFTRTVTTAEIAAGEINAPATVTAKSRNHFFARNLNAKLPLSSIASFDSFASATITPSAVGNLNPGNFTTFTANYLLLQSDIDQGFVDNTATATALSTTNQVVTSIDTFHQPIVQVPGVAVIKTGQVDLGTDNVASLNDVVTYHFAVTNTGNVTLTNVKVSDTNATVVGAPIATLAPGDTDILAYSATHLLDQSNLDAGQVSNQATVTGTPPIGGDVSKLSDDDKLTEINPTIISLAPAPKIALLKTVFAVTDVNNNGFTDKNDTITYHFAVTNTGNQTLVNILVTDPLVAVGDINGNLPAQPLASLNPGQTDSTYFISVYKITQNDVDHGDVENTAKVVGTAPGNVEVIDYSDPGVLTKDGPTISVIVPKPLISLIKNENGITDTNTNLITDAGDVIHYTFKVENIGNVTLTNVNIADHLAGATVNGLALPSLSPLTFDATNFTADYTITPADVLAGSVSNQATATGKPPVGQPVSDLSDNAAPNLNNPTITAITPLPSIAVIKTILSIVDSNNTGHTDPGDTINYVFSIKNTGNMALNNVTVSDNLASVTGLPIPVLQAGAENTIAYKATHIITSGDIAAGQFANRAKVKGTTSTNTIVYDDSDNDSYTQSEFTVATFASQPSIALVKSVDTITDSNHNGLDDVGDIINYKLVITNTGNVDLTNIQITDQNGTLHGGPLNTLAANATDSATFTVTHPITTADFLAGLVINQAQVAGDPPSTLTKPNPPPVLDLSDPLSITSNSPTVTPLAAVPGIALLKKVSSIGDTNHNGVTDYGDVINYVFDVVNTGNVDLTAVVLSDLVPLVTVSPGAATLASLPKGTHNDTYFTATHTIDGNDAEAGQFSNTAKITAKTPTNTTIADTSDDASLTGNAPTITPVINAKPVLTKTANKSEVKRGETVTYTITASNLVGTSYTITDIMPPEFGFVAGSATVNDVSIAATASGRDITFAGITPVTGKITIKLKLIASTTLAGGKFTNNAVLTNDITGQVVAKAQATVTIAIETIFDCSDVIGHVFDDQNANGYMDDGEPGLPGVRVVTLNGILITTDSEGRYHVPCAAVPDSKIGSNYLLKLDTRTLPTGYKLTTENPRDVRVTKGKIVKLNFGATLAHVVTLDLTAKAFDEGTIDLKTKWIAGIDKLMAVLKKKHASLKIVYHPKSESAAFAAERLSAIQDTIIFAWENSSPTYDLDVTTSVENGQ